MLQIFSIPHSLYCAKLRILLRHKGLVWEEPPPPGGYGSDEYKTVVPSGNLPALVDGDLVIADSEAIAEYLEEVHPLPTMLPGAAAERAHARGLSRFHDTRLEPALRLLFPYLPGRASAPEGVLTAGADKVSERLAQLARMLGPEAGSVLTLGDCGYPITFAWLDGMAPRMGFEIEWPDEVVAYRQALVRHPSVADELADYVPKIEDFLGS